MEERYIVRYSNGQAWKSSTVMKKHVAEKCAELLQANGYTVEIHKFRG